MCILMYSVVSHSTATSASGAKRIGSPKATAVGTTSATKTVRGKTASQRRAKAAARGPSALNARAGVTLPKIARARARARALARARKAPRVGLECSPVLNDTLSFHENGFNCVCCIGNQRNVLLAELNTQLCEQEQRANDWFQAPLPDGKAMWLPRMPLLPLCD